MTFLNDTTSCIDSDSMADITLTFKPKRMDVSNRDSIYINYLSQLQLEQKVEHIEADINLYTLISSTNPINVIPFSSPAFIAAELEVPAIIYNPSSILNCNHCLPDNIEFIQHSDQLKFKLRQTLLTLATSAYTS